MLCDAYFSIIKSGSVEFCRGTDATLIVLSNLIIHLDLIVELPLQRIQSLINILIGIKKQAYIFKN